MNLFDAVKKVEQEKGVAHQDYRHEDVKEIGVSEFRLYTRHLRVLGWYDKKAKNRIVV